MSMDEDNFFELKNKRYKVYRGLNKLINARNRNVLASRLRPAETFKGGKCYLTGEGYYIMWVTVILTDKLYIINIVPSRLLYGNLAPEIS